MNEASVAPSSVDSMAVVFFILLILFYTLQSRKAIVIFSSGHDNSSVHEYHPESALKWGHILTGLRFVLTKW